MKIRVLVVAVLLMPLIAEIITGEEAGENILDNRNTEVCFFETRAGQWQVKEGEGFAGSVAYVLSDARSVPAATAKATWKLPVKGKTIWEVYIHWTAEQNRYPFVSYTVLNHEDWLPGKGLRQPRFAPPLVNIISMWNGETGQHGVDATTFWVDQRYYEKEPDGWVKQEGDKPVNSGWLWLGTYEFDQAKSPAVFVTSSQEGWATRGKVIVADAVKIVPVKGTPSG